MAVTESGALLTEAHRLAQGAIARELVGQLRLTWPMLDVHDLDGTAPKWYPLAMRILELEFGKSRTAATNYLIDFVKAERGVASAPFVFDEAMSLDEHAVLALQYAGPVKIKQGIAAGLTPDQARSNAFAELAREAQKYVLEGGRRQIAETVKRDRSARGFQRVTDGNPCFFCAMLAARGPVYKDSSFTSSNYRFWGKGTAKVHNGCGCTIEPIYGADPRWVGDAEEWSRIWESSTKGLSGNEAVAAFRAAWSAR